MKKLFSLAIALVAAFSCAQAQNIQLHYDLGHSLYKDLTPRQSVTTTVEMFKPDTWGSTFLFIDLDYKNDGVKGSYWEIAREFNVTKNPRKLRSWRNSPACPALRPHKEPSCQPRLWSRRLPQPAGNDCPGGERNTGSRRLMEESDARVAELTDIVNHLSEKLRDRDALIKDQEAQLNALRSQLLTNGAPAGATIKKVSNDAD